ncbi:MAG: hypothetical protein ABFC89_09195 [Methanospirillum sp.]
MTAEGGKAPPDELRRQAEAVVAARRDRTDGPLSHEDALALVHELQNEELLRMRREAEVLRDRYAATSTTSRRSATPPSTDRQGLIGARFAVFLHPGSRAAFAAFLDRMRHE